MNLTEFISRQNKPVRGATGVVLIAGFTALDKASPLGFEASVFYLIPVSFFAWFLGRRPGLAVSLLCTWIAFSLHRANPLLSRSDLAYWNAVAWLAVYVFFVYIISEIRVLYARERNRSQTDPLTGIPNRRSFFEHLGTESHRARRYSRSISLAYIDLDHFKEINDTFGHETGDRLLAVVAGVIKRDSSSTRSWDCRAQKRSPAEFET